MNRHSDPHRSLHLVTAGSAENPQPEHSQPDDKVTSQLAEGIRKFHALWSEFDTEAFSEHPDHQHMGELVLEIHTLRERLAAHGVQVRP